MRHIDGCLGDGRIHIHDRLAGALEGAGEQLYAVEARPQIAARHLRGLVGRRSFGELHLRWQIGGMAAFRKDTARRMDIWARHFPGIDPAAQRQGIAWVGANIPDGRKTPPRQHLPHMLLQRCGGSGACVFPYRLREVDVAVPEARNHRHAGAINDARIGGNLYVAAASDRGDDAVSRDDDRIVERRGVRRRVDLAADEGEGLRVGRSADAGGRRKKAMEKRGAEQISNHAEPSIG